MKLFGFTITKEKKIEVDEEAKYKEEQLNKEFTEVMGYNLAKALERKR